MQYCKFSKNFKSIFFIIMKSKLFQIVVISMFFSACSNEPVFEITDDGLEYYFVERNDTNQSVNIGDGLVVDMKFFWNDSLLFNTREIAVDYRIELVAPNEKGSIYDGLAMMKLGDSAIFIVDAFNFYHLTASIPTPNCIRKGDKLRFQIRLIDIMTPKDLQLEYERIQRMKLKNEQDLLKDYLSLNEIDIKPEQNGLYYQEIKKGFGKKPEMGDSITVHYEATLINGEPFDSSLKNGRPFSFIYGDKLLIEGWNLGIGMMLEGGKALIIIPSNLAFGESGVGNIIPPYSTVIYELHLLKIKKNK